MFKFWCVIFFICLPACLCNSDIILDNPEDYICQFTKCLNKCCSKNQYVNTTVWYLSTCVENDENYNLDFSNVQLYDTEEHSRKINKKLGDLFRLKPGLFNDNETFFSFAAQLDLLQLISYLNEDGYLYLESPNAYKRWRILNKDNFCVDYGIKNNISTIQFWGILEDEYQPPAYKTYYQTSGLIISSIFLFLLFLVYCVLPELRNIGGMVLMAYVISLMGAFVSLTVMNLSTLRETDCIVITTFIYFFFLSAFTWMNVMSFDIWWTFRGYAKARPIHRKGEKFKFCMYCLYAWGVPLSMSIGFVLINAADLRDMPWFIQPNVPAFGCFINGGQQFVYLYIPMLILIICNWMFYLLTAFNIWRLSRGTARVLNSEAAGNPAAHRTQKQRFMVYIKLSVIMGINWILEVISSFSPELNIWFVSDTYNLFIGVIIFLIFICKRSIYNKLLIRFKGMRQYNLPKRSLTSSFTLESNLSQEAPPSVCVNPKGERKRSLEQKPTFEI
ncbi:G-protein coupled receptor Mth2-like [Colias croceus]|uniref:G-protein coupled receptor Mth2-like n=1 Tax=Colias crocea TaxID=72248 RepID=UPI001E27BBA8|nr:G-protein coupled receptor Mth2-like [Colias croceus]